MTFLDRCPNCDEQPQYCLCTHAEILEATEIRRRIDRDYRLSQGRPVLVDHTKRPEEPV